MAIGCPECGALEEIPPLGKRMVARCDVCRISLERTAGRSVGAAFACALSTFLLLIPANFEPLLSVSAMGAERTSRLGSGVAFIWGQGWVIVAILLGLFGLVLPLVRFGGLSLVLGLTLRRASPTWLGRLYRWVMQMDIWAMPDVFLVGFFVGYSRVHQHLSARLGAGGYCFIAAALLSMLTRATLDRRTVWRSIAPERPILPGRPVLSCTACDLIAPIEAEGSACARCGLRLRARKPDAVKRAIGFSLAALVLYAPANIYPMTITTQLGQETPRRIIDGVKELFTAGLWPLGILIFCTSIAIPLLKLAGMGWFVVSISARSRRHLRFKTHLHHIIDELGRWSNVDVFALIVFIPLIRFDGLASSWMAPGATAFTLVVVLTMAASRCFDPRLMWDAAEASRE